MTKRYDALALLSGGLDSILAMRTLMDQGLSVLGLHFVSPFFGKPHLLGVWREQYGIDGVAVDISREYTNMLLDGPPSGFGKWLNPCIDCKVAMLSRAKTLLPEYGASFLVTGEVSGQRPMSQRKDALNRISKKAGVRDVLLRPLCAKGQPITPMEESGLVDRERLHDWYGRGRKPQMAAAQAYGFTEVPTPAGGCVLTEGPSSARFVRLIRIKGRPDPQDFVLAQVGRQVWAGNHWLVTTRRERDNELLDGLIRPADYVFRVKDFPSPTGVGRPLVGDWSPEAVLDAAAWVASYSSKAVRHSEISGDPIQVRVRRGTASEVVSVLPNRETPLGWTEAKPGEVREWKEEHHG